MFKIKKKIVVGDGTKLIRSKGFLFESECIVSRLKMTGSKNSTLKLDQSLASLGESVPLLTAKTAIRRLCRLIRNWLPSEPPCHPNRKGSETPAVRSEVKRQSCLSSSIDIAQNVSAGALILEFEEADHDERYK